MVSEDSDQLVSGFLAVHRLSDLRDLDQPHRGQVMTAVDQLNTPCELLEVLLLRGTHRILLKERYDRFQQILALPHDVTIQVLFVVVVSPIDDNLTNPEEFTQFIQTGYAFGTLRNRKLMSHLKAGSVAFTTYPIILPDKADGEAPFSIYKTNNPATSDQPFLLIARTGRIVTAHTLLYGRVPPDTPGFPAYSQMLTTLLPARRAANIYLRTVIVTAAIDQRFSRQLRQAPKGKANRLP